MIEPPACSSCGAPFSNQAPEGFCPACMFEGALELGHGMVDARSPVSGLPQLGDYQLLAEIARGGMGVVYRARQLSLDRKVAVKLILIGQFADKSVINRFKAEAAAAARLRHPHIVAIHEIGEEKGQHFFSMEYIEGQNLAEFIRQKPLTIRQSAQLVAKVAAAVQFAHEHGIVHRDLKPSNILMDSLLEPRITDFGLARDLQSDSELTLTGQVLGSPNYISPEQASGNTSAAAGDIYSLGAILYHLLTGRPPFAAETLTATLQQVTTAEPVSPRILDPSVPRDLETICLKCLEKEPEKRFPAASALAAELQRYLNDEPIHARPISRPAKVWRWCRRKPVVTALAASIAFILCLGFIGIYWQWRRAEQNLYFSTMRQVQDELEQENIGQARKLLENYQPKWWKKDLRGWEWYYAFNESKSDALLSIRQHERPVYSVSISKDGSMFACAGEGPVMLWDIETGANLKTQSFGQSVPALTFSRDNSEIIGGTSDGRLVEWNLSTGQTNTVLTNLSHVRSLALSPDGDLLAIYTHDGLALWKTDDHQFVTGFPETWGTDNLPGGAAFARDSRTMAYAREGGEIVLWDIKNSSEIAVFRGHEQSVTGLAFSPDGSTLVSGSRDRTVRIWEVRSGKELRRLTGFSAFVTNLGISPDGGILAVVGAGQYVRVFETDFWREIRTLKGHSDASRAVAFTPDGKRMVTACNDGTVNLWSASLVEQRRSERLPAGAGVSILPGAKGLYLQFTNGTYAYWNNEAANEKAPTHFPLPDVGLGTVSPDGKFLAIAMKSGVQVFDHLTQELCLDLALPHSARNFAFSRDSRFLAIRGGDNICRIWRVAPESIPARSAGSLLASLQLKDDMIRTFKFSSNDRYLCVTYSESETAEIWNIAAQTKTELTTPGGISTDLAIARDESIAASTTGGGALAIWNARTGGLVAALGGQLGTLWSVDFSPDDTRIAACGGDGTIRMWDRDTLQEVARWRLHDERLWQLAFSETGESLYVLGQDTSGGRRLFSLRAPKRAAF